MRNGKSFVIHAKNNNPKNMYVANAKLKNRAYTKNFLKHEDITSGGVLKINVCRGKQTKRNQRKIFHTL
ncbi:MAG: glycoside hydrolase family 92 protein [Saprospiraceae bacterium]|nr:glycoside hydrolase family 92 protein [Saprospiraceae bacterium]